MPPAKKILIVDDEAMIRKAVRLALEKEGYEVVEAETGGEAMRRIELGKPDLILLDVMLPDVSGFDVCRDIRKAGLRVPIIILSAKTEEIDVVVGLEIGADDYITKPFRPKELVARVKAILRRSIHTRGRPAPAVYKTGDIVLDEATHEVRTGEVPVHLSPTEFKLLRHFMANPGRVLTQEEILEGVWGYDADVGGDLVKLNVSRLRRKLGADGLTRDVIQTVPGVGYLFKGAEGGVQREEARPHS